MNTVAIMLLSAILTAVHLNNKKSSRSAKFYDKVHYDTVSTVKLKGILYKGADYTLLDLRDFQNFYEKIEILNKRICVAAIFLPANIPQNFMVDTLEENSKGFDFAVEYGSRYFYKKQFYFVFKNNTFYLSRVKTETFDKAKPENTDKTKSIVIYPLIPVSKFKMEVYMND